MENSVPEPSRVTADSLADEQTRLRSAVTRLIRDHVGGRPSQIFAASDAIVAEIAHPIIAERDDFQKLAGSADKLAWSMAERAEKVEAELSAAVGYLRNAGLDLKCGAPKETALRTINGGLARFEAFLASLSSSAEPSNTPADGS